MGRVSTHESLAQRSLRAIGFVRGEQDPEYRLRSIIRRQPPVAEKFASGTEPAALLGERAKPRGGIKLPWGIEPSQLRGFGPQRGGENDCAGDGVSSCLDRERMQA